MAPSLFVVDKERTVASRTLSIDLKALAEDLNALRDELNAERGPEDLRHLRKMIWWGRASSLLGYLSSGIAPNPISAFLMSSGRFSRWAMVTHHIMHRGYDKVEDAPDHLTSKKYARGWRRFVDWFEWMHPEAWRHEHNTLHHYKLGEVHDPDQPELNLEFLRDSPLPMWARHAFVALASISWKAFYYAPNTYMELHHAKRRRQKLEAEDLSLFSPAVWLPWKSPGRDLWFKSYLPYAIRTFGLLPLPFLLFGPWAYTSALVNIILAEALTNFHAFVVIVPNHAGDDIYRFDRPIKDRDEFYLRQIVGSVNYRTGGDLNDFLHGWLNYQIEHHLWPDMTMLQYRKAQPRVKEICERHGVPYVQESVWKRAKKLVDVMVGKTDMMHWDDDYVVTHDGNEPVAHAV